MFYILSDASGALIIFGLLVVYFKMQTHQPISRDPDDQSSFVGAKKLIVLALLTSLAIIAADVVWTWATAGTDRSFLEIFYTLLIFADVLIVLISLRYSVAYPVCSATSASQWRRLSFGSL